MSKQKRRAKIKAQGTHIDGETLIHIYRNPIKNKKP